MTLLVVYALVTGFLVASAAWALEGVCRTWGRPIRFVWAGALLLSVALVGIAPLRSAPAVVSGSPETAMNTVGRTLPPVFAAAGSVLPAGLDPYVTAGWLGASALTFLAFAVGLVRFRRIRRDWPMADLQGVRVRLAPGGGPLVVGLSRSEIIVPRWLLGLGAKEQRMVLAHEGEHARARDPLLLGVSCALVALLPWHPASWWMLSRVRLGVELDCDLRVLRRGFGARTYGELLVDLAGRNAGFPSGMPALAQVSNLQRRLLALNPTRVRFPRARAGVLGIFAFSTLLVACEATVPSGVAESGAKAQPVTLEALVRNRPLLVLNGVRLQSGGGDVTKEIDPNSIENVEVVKGNAAVAQYGDDGRDGVIIINTKKNYGADPDSMIKFLGRANGERVVFRKLYVNRKGEPIYRKESPGTTGH